MDPDLTLSELKKLREGRGLRADRIAQAPSVLSSLATSDAAEGLQTLKLIIERMCGSDAVRALKVDFGWALDELLGRKPTSRELEHLGERRNSYATVIGKDDPLYGIWWEWWRHLRSRASVLVSTSFRSPGTPRMVLRVDAISDS